MAIVKMKRLHLIGLRSDQEELLRLLQRMGCVEIDEPEQLSGEELPASLTQPDSAALNAARDNAAILQTALETLKRYAKPKGGLLAGRPVISEREFFDDRAYAAASDIAREINRAERQVSAFQAELAKLKGQKLALEPWLSMEAPLDASSTREAEVQFGTIPTRTPLEEVAAALANVSPLIQLIPAATDTDAHHVLFLCHRSVLEQANAVLKEYGFSAVSMKGWTGTAADNDRRLDGELEQAAAGVEAETAAILALADRKKPLEQALDRANQDVRREEAKARLLDTESAFYLDGWIPAEEEGRLSKTLSGFACAWETIEPDPEEYPQVPVKLKNSWFARPLNMVTDMYALPAYGSVDPNPLMAPFFIIFYGFMMADMGYGLVMMLVSLFVIKKTKPKGATVRYMFPLLGLCGVSTFVWGALTGGFFGDMLPQLAQIINPNTTFTSMPALFSPTGNALEVLIFSLVLGVIQIFTGMAVSMYKKIKQGKVMDAICNEGAWYAVFLCAGVGVAINQVGPALIVALVIIVLTQSYGCEGILGRLMGIGGSLYNNITGYFSDILSYSRLMALMLAGAVIAQVFNTLGAITGNVITFFLISLIGNGLNFALNILGCYVHDMRLQCLEYFSRFYEDGGKPFRPLDITTQYVDVDVVKE